MHSLFIYSGGDELAAAAARAAQARGFAVSQAADEQAAEALLGGSAYSLGLATTPLTPLQQDILSDFLWAGNDSAPFFLIAREKLDAAAARFLGAEVLEESSAIIELEAALDELQTRPKIAKEDFEILIVEDLEHSLEIMCLYVEGLGYPAGQGVSSGSAALDALRQANRNFSCVISDMSMPGMTGLELLSEIRNDPELNGLPVIILTAYGTPDCFVDCLRAGATGFIAKPPKKADLARELGRALRKTASGRPPMLVSDSQAENMRLLIERKLLSGD